MSSTISAVQDTQGLFAKNSSESSQRASSMQNGNDERSDQTKKKSSKTFDRYLDDEKRTERDRPAKKDVKNSAELQKENTKAVKENNKSPMAKKSEAKDSESIKESEQGESGKTSNSDKNIVAEKKKKEAFRQILGQPEQLLQELPVLAFVSNKMENVIPESIPKLVSSNNFIQKALNHSTSIEGYLQEPMSVKSVLMDLGISNDKLNNLEMVGVLSPPEDSPKEILKDLGVDPHRVVVQLSKLQQELPISGVHNFIEDAIVAHQKVTNLQMAQGQMVNDDDSFKSHLQGVIRQQNQQNRMNQMIESQPYGANTNPEVGQQPLNGTMEGSASGNEKIYGMQLTNNRMNQLNQMPAQGRIPPTSMPELAQSQVSPSARDSMLYQNFSGYPDMKDQQNARNFVGSSQYNSSPNLNANESFLLRHETNLANIVPLGIGDQDQGKIKNPIAIEQIFTPDNIYQLQNNFSAAKTGYPQDTSQGLETAQSNLLTENSPRFKDADLRPAKQETNSLQNLSSIQQPGVQISKLAVQPQIPGVAFTNLQQQAQLERSNFENRELVKPDEVVEQDGTLQAKESLIANAPDKSMTNLRTGTPVNHQEKLVSLTAQDKFSDQSFDEQSSKEEGNSKDSDRPNQEKVDAPKKHQNSGTFSLSQNDRPMEQIQNTNQTSHTTHQAAKSPDVFRQKLFDQAQMLMAGGGGNIQFDVSDFAPGQKLGLTVQVAGGEVNIKMLAPNREIQEMIAMDIGHLKEALHQQNLKLNAIDVGVDHNQFNNPNHGQDNFNRGFSGQQGSEQSSRFTVANRESSAKTMVNSARGLAKSIQRPVIDNNSSINVRV